MAKLPFRARPKSNVGQTPSSAATPSHLHNQTISQTRPPPPPPPRDGQDKGDKSKKRDATEASRNTQSEKQKSVVVEDSPTDPVSMTFGGIASGNYTELDVRTLQGRNDQEGEFAFNAGLGDTFYHGLRVLNLKNSLIKDQDKSLKRLGNEVQTLSSKMGEIQKKAAEEVGLLKEDAEKSRAELEQMKRDFEKVAQPHESEVSKIQGEHDTVKAAFGRDRDELYEIGILDYLRSFLAANPEYDWSVHFPPSTPSFMSKFKAKNAESIDEAKEKISKQFKEEAEKAVVDARGENVDNVLPSQQAAS